MDEPFTDYDLDEISDPGMEECVAEYVSRGSTRIEAFSACRTLRFQYEKAEEKRKRLMLKAVLKEMAK